MTSEDDFQRMLDADPSDHATRLVFADWLEERGDPRAEGYRALGVLGWGAERVPSHGDDEVPYPLGGYWFLWEEFPWFDSLPIDGTDAGDSGDSGHNRRYYRTRRRAEDAAARAFARLPAERRAELLSAAPGVI